MPFLVGPRLGTWEIRESRGTPHGPRSRTLATFKLLTPEIIELASRRSLTNVDAAQLRRAAVRRGAPVAQPAPDRAAAELLAELAEDRHPRPVLARLLREALPRAAGMPSAGAQSAAAWVAATPQRRGEALYDLLLLADRLPSGRRGARSSFPRVRSAPAGVDAAGASAR